MDLLFIDVFGVHEYDPFDSFSFDYSFFFHLTSRPERNSRNDNFLTVLKE